MQSGRNNRLDTRVPNPINRGNAGYLPKPVKHVDMEKKRSPGMAKPGATSVINLPDDGKGKAPRKGSNVTNIPKMKPAKPDKYFVDHSIQKLLSLYEEGEKSNGGKGKDDRKAKLLGKVISPEKPIGRRVSPVTSEKGKVSNVEKSIRKVDNCCKIPQRRRAKPEQPAAKPVANSITESVIISSVSQNKKKLEEGTPTAVDTQSDRLIPIMTPEHQVEAPIDIINSFITNYLEEKVDDRPLDFLLTGCDDRSVFPVCSKKATDNIPSSELSVAQECQPLEKSDLVVMGRRNSEPYSPKSCILRYADAEKPGSWNLGGHTIQNYYFWEPGPTQQLKPYWEVSLFKNNRSLSVLSSRVASGMISLAPTPDGRELLQAGQFRKAVTDTTKPSWLREVSSISDEHIQTMPFITLMERGKVLSREPEMTPKEEEEPESPPSSRRQPRIFSKDDQYKPPGHLLIYVKSSQKKLVTVEASESHPENVVNRKVHKLTRIRRMNSDARAATSWDKKLMAKGATAVVFVLAVFVYLLYFFTKRHTVLNLTPPIPGLVRGY